MKYRDMTPAQREAARLDAVRFQILYNGKDKDIPIRNFTLRDGKAKARRFFRAEQRAGRDVSFWDTYDNAFSRDFFSFG